MQRWSANRFTDSPREVAACKSMSGKMRARVQCAGRALAGLPRPQDPVGALRLKDSAERQTARRKLDRSLMQSNVEYVMANN